MDQKYIQQLFAQMLLIQECSKDLQLNLKSLQ